MGTLKVRLQELYDQYKSNMGSYAWACESDRWDELVFCLLHQCAEQEPELTRAAVAALRNLSLLDVGKMLHLNDATHEDRVVFAYLLKQHGFSKESVALACRLLGHVAHVVQQSYGGKIQRYLRRHGEVMRDELVSAFDGASLDKSRMTYAVSHWLQNVLSLPISLQHAAVVAFCQESAVNQQDVWQAADELDLNLAVIDDLLEIQIGMRQGAGKGANKLGPDTR